MRVWCFSGTDGLGALTGVENGANLPSKLGPWRPVTSTVLRDDQADEAEARQLIAEHGFCCFDEAPGVDRFSPVGGR